VGAFGAAGARGAQGDKSEVGIEVRVEVRVKVKVKVKVKYGERDCPLHTIKSHYHRRQIFLAAS
jgi:hypothetical protein